MNEVPLMTTRWFRFLALLPILVLAACGAESPSQPAATSGRSSLPAASAPGEPAVSTDPSSGAGADGDVAHVCELLSDADIVELTTLEVDTVEARPAGGIFENACWWALAGGGVVQAEIVLGVFEPGGREYYDTYYAPFIEANGQEPLEGVGYAGHIGSGIVTVVADDALVDLTWASVSDDSTTVPVALTERVVANLAGE